MLAKLQKLIDQGENLFITGSAGTGKSHLIKEICQAYGRVFAIELTASTGIAAVHVGGVTIHSWACLGTGDKKTDDIVSYVMSGAGTRVRRKLKETQILIIDEISMIGPEIFDQLNEVLKIVRNNKTAFGGLQIIVVGDFLQLPPVNKHSQESFFCFESQAWNEADFKNVILEKNYRQNDGKFLKILSNLRKATLDDEDVATLNSRIKMPNLEAEIKPTIIVTHNAQVERINNHKIQQINEETKVFSVNCEGSDRDVSFLQRNCLAPETLKLKIGAQVMMLKNSYQKQGIYNGSLGIVRDFSPKNYPIVEFENGKEIKIMPDSWTIEKFNDEIGEFETKARIVQIPLNLAWAITVHKSQGMTLDSIYCDLTNAFTEGQIYVTISRVKSLDGLYIKGINLNSLKINEKIAQFYEQIELENVNV